MNTKFRVSMGGALLLVLSSCKAAPEQGASTTSKEAPTPAKPEPATPEVAVDPPAPEPAPKLPDNPLCSAINPCVTCNVTTPDTPITAALLSSGMPCAVSVIPPIDLPNLQHAFDYHSWLVFLAINAPAGGGVIGSGAAPGGDAATLWETWRNVADVMLPGGVEPPPWDTPPVVPPACAKLGAANGHVLRMVGKTPDLLNEFDQPFDTGPLIDQFGRYVRYEILVNRPMFEYIVQNKLYSKAGQQAFTDEIVFPEGRVFKDSSDGQIGAIMVKAAWKLLDEGELATNYHTTQALIYTPPSDNPKIEESCHEATVALVGLHVVQKTEVEPQWVWSTYEHAANVPDDGKADPAKTYNFYDPACPPSKCPVNTPPARPWDPNVEPFPNGFKSQITRVTPITDEVAQLNTGFTGILPNTVWANYELISTQWPTDGQSVTDPNGVPAPVYLANTTMETYVQGTVPQSSSSCMACHGNAAATTGRESDFTFILERAD